MVWTRTVTVAVSCSYYTALETRIFFAGDLGLKPVTTVFESSQSNGMAEALVKTIKRDYPRFVPKPNVAAVMAQLPGWFAHDNALHS
jgi:putative transposase